MPSVDFTGLIPDFSTVTTGILAVAAAVASVYVAFKGVKLVLRAIVGVDPYDGTGPSGLDFRDL